MNDPRTPPELPERPSTPEVPQQPSRPEIEERIDPAMVAAVGVGAGALLGGTGTLLSGIADIKGSGDGGGQQSPPAASQTPPAEKD
jgi:hypothetical protein